MSVKKDAYGLWVSSRVKKREHCIYQVLIGLKVEIFICEIPHWLERERSIPYKGVEASP